MPIPYLDDIIRKAALQYGISAGEKLMGSSKKKSGLTAEQKKKQKSNSTVQDMLNDKKKREAAANKKLAAVTEGLTPNQKKLRTAIDIIERNNVVDSGGGYSPPDTSNRLSDEMAGVPRHPVYPNVNGVRTKPEATSVEGFTRYTPTDPNSGTSPIYSNLGLTALQRELQSRKANDVGYVKSGDQTRYVGGKPIDPEKIAMLENIGLVKKGNLNPNQPSGSVGQPTISSPASPSGVRSFVGNAEGVRDLYNTDVTSSTPEGLRGRRVPTLNMNREGNGPKIIPVGNSGGSNFFSAIANIADARRNEAQSRFDTRFERKQSREDAKAASEIANKNKITEWYDDDIQSKIKNREANTDHTITDTSTIIPTSIANNALTDAKTGKTIAETKEIPANAEINRLYKQAQTGNINALARLNNIKAENLPAEMQAKIRLLNSRANRIDATTLLTKQQKELLKSRTDMNDAQLHEYINQMDTPTFYKTMRTLGIY